MRQITIAFIKKQIENLQHDMQELTGKTFKLELEQGSAYTLWKCVDASQGWRTVATGKTKAELSSKLYAMRELLIVMQVR